MTSPRPDAAILRVEELAKHFGGVRALDGVTLDVRGGEALGLIGPNGSGKTTLVNCVSGVLAPSGGTIVLEGSDVTRWSRARRARAGLVRTYQNLRLFHGLTAAENVEVGLLTVQVRSGAARRRAVADALELQGLANVARTTVSQLAYGQQRRVEIARAIVSRPRVLLLDEPAAGLGEEETAVLQETLARARAELGFAMLMIDHDVSLIMRVSSRVIALHEGRILAEGRPEEIAANPDVIAVYLGTTEQAA